MNTMKIRDTIRLAIDTLDALDTEYVYHDFGDDGEPIGEHREMCLIVPVENCSTTLEIAIDLLDDLDKERKELANRLRDMSTMTYDPTSIVGSRALKQELLDIADELDTTDDDKGENKP